MKRQDSALRETNLFSDSCREDHSLYDHVAFVEPLQRDVETLKNVLMDTVEVCSSPSAFARLCEVLDASKAIVDSDDCSVMMKQLYSDLSSFTVEELELVVTFFGHMSSLATYAEYHHRIRRRRAYERDAGASAYLAEDQTLTYTLSQLLEKPGVNRDDIAAKLAKQRIDLVLTAHPTEALRHSHLHLFRLVAENLGQLDRPDLTPNEVELIKQKMMQYVRTIWRTDMLRTKKPTPSDEAQNVANVIEDVIFPSLPRFLRLVDRNLDHHNMPPLPLDAKPFKFSSWAGGDRDGNAFVTSDVTRRVAISNLLRGCDLFLNRIENLIAAVPIHSSTPEFQTFVNSLPHFSDLPKYDDFLHRQKTLLVRTTEGESYRRLWLYMRYRLNVSIEVYEDMLQHESSVAQQTTNPLYEYMYKSTGELITHLKLAYESLQKSGDSLIAEGELKDTIRLAEMLGLTLLTMELRQESSRHSRCLHEVFEYVGLGKFESLSEEGKQNLLVDILMSRRPFIPNPLPQMLSPESREVLNTFRCAAELPEESIERYIISMCHEPSDVLAVHAIQKEYMGSEGRSLRVVPLLETIADLAGARKMLNALFHIPWYLNHLMTREGGVQEVMLGYSDSAKDGGRLVSALTLYEAQNELKLLCESFGARVVFFHGRGGTVGRGGGPQHTAILSQPPGTIEGQLRITVQGEVINQIFGLNELGCRNLEAYVAAVLQTEYMKAGDCGFKGSRCNKILTEMGEISQKSYRDIVLSSEFPKFMKMVTPLDFIGSLHMGSRPAKRSQKNDDPTLDTLRAIPWIFAWSQNRLLLPIWLGVGDALNHMLQNDRLEDLTQLYINSPFFKNFISSLEMVLSKCAPDIFLLYVSTLYPEALPFANQLLDKLSQTIQIVLKVTSKAKLLANEKVTQRALDIRKPWLIPCNLVQIEALRRLRAVGEDSALQRVLAISIKAVASGMQNTG